jgi:hypothetical protein
MALLATPSGCSMLHLQGDAVDAINHSMELTEADRIDRLRLIQSDNVGPLGVMARTPQRVGSERPWVSGRISLLL